MQEKRFYRWIYRNKTVVIVVFVLVIGFVLIKLVNPPVVTRDEDYYAQMFNFSVINEDFYYVWQPYFNQIYLPDSSVIYGVEGESRFTINGLGYRGSLIDNKEEEFRILTIGGSVTESLYLDDFETWPYLIMDKLGMTEDGREVIVMNVGQSRHTTRDYIFEMKHLTESYDPNLVIFLIGANDMMLKMSIREAWRPFDEDSYDYNRTFYYIPGEGELLPWKSNLKTRWPVALGKSLVEMRLERKNSESIIYPPELDIVLSDYEKNLNRLIEISKEKNVSVLFVTQPYLWKKGMSEVEDSALWISTDFNGRFYSTESMIESMDKFNSKMLDVCSENPDVYCLDLEKEVEKSLGFFYDDLHLNERGSEFVAEQIAGYIGENFLGFW
ncbi:MAG: SGNH/GDSL hydrolase family protein [Nanoarchaeota archaeon]|nr:SGNH/GDSL hydrolase family protein [Nanoarchaeota archaeon]MBU1103537.1 SGNH/GDSL hydrolase family protein [Nanoarchaeota archaeon]